MQTLDPFPQAANEPTLDGVTVAQVRAALPRILESQPFRTSRQCQALLTYIVEHSLGGHEEDLRERILGVEVFGRSADYDTGEDPVVRMRAADVRKRLAQFYQSAEPQRLHIEIKSGSYRASFRWSDEAADEKTPPLVPATLTPLAVSAPAGLAEVSDQRLLVAAAHPTIVAQHRRRLVWTALVLLLLVAAGVGARLWNARTDRAEDRFWAPVNRTAQPVLLYLGANAAYRFTPDYLAHYRSEHGLADQNGPEFFPVLPPGSTVRSEDLVPIKGTFTSGSDAQAAVLVATALNRHAHPFTMRFGYELSMSDLRNTPAVLIGGFNNRWTLETVKPLPLTLRDGISIVDQQHPEHHWTIDPNDQTETKDDYALVSRIATASTGGPVISLAGIGSFGTQAAAEFVCSPERMAELFRAAPANWGGGNLQVVLRIHVVDFQPVSTEIVTARFW